MFDRRETVKSTETAGIVSSTLSVKRPTIDFFESGQQVVIPNVDETEVVVPVSGLTSQASGAESVTSSDKKNGLPSRVWRLFNLMKKAGEFVCVNNSYASAPETEKPSVKTNDNRMRLS